MGSLNDEKNILLALDEFYRMLVEWITIPNWKFYYNRLDRFQIFPWLFFFFVKILCIIFAKIWNNIIIYFSLYYTFYWHDERRVTSKKKKACTRLTFHSCKYHLVSTSPPILHPYSPKKINDRRHLHASRAVSSKNKEKLLSGQASGSWRNLISPPATLLILIIY